MVSINNNKGQFATSELRHLAEKRLSANTTEPSPPLTEEALRRLVHELEVHQIELEMQNEELNQARNEVDTALEKYTELYDFAPVGYFTLDRIGTISRVNLTGAGLLAVERSRLVGKRLEHYFTAEVHPAFNAYLERVFTSPAKAACEVVSFPVK